MPGSLFSLITSQEQKKVSTPPNEHPTISGKIKDSTQKSGKKHHIGVTLDTFFKRIFQHTLSFSHRLPKILRFFISQYGHLIYTPNIHLRRNIRRPSEIWMEITLAVFHQKNNIPYIHKNVCIYILYILHRSFPRKRLAPANFPRLQSIN